jgi:transposase
MSETRDTSVRSNEGAAGVDAPVGRVGGSSPSTLSTGEAASEGERPEVGPLGPRQRWSLARKRAVVMRMLRGESVELLSRALGVPVHKLERWRDKAEAALDGALKERAATATLPVRRRPARVELKAKARPLLLPPRSGTLARRACGQREQQLPVLPQRRCDHPPRRRPDARDQRRTGRRAQMHEAWKTPLA